MIHLTRRVFTDLAIWMIGLGLLMGIVFPFFLIIMGIPWGLVITPWFFFTCMAAGFIVSGVNIWLAKAVVGKRLRLLANHMKMVETSLIELAKTGNSELCTPEACMITVDSEDELGDASQAFNFLIEALAASHRSDIAIRSFSSLLASQLELEGLSMQALQHLLKHTNATAGTLLLAFDGEMKLVASCGIRTPALLINNDYVKRVMQTGHDLNIAIPDDVTIDGVLADFRPKEVIVYPLFFKGVTLGVIVLANASTFKEETVSSLSLFCQSMAISLNNAINYDHLQKMVAMDPLTGIYNRRFGMARLSEEFSRAVRMATPLGVLMFDIDHFKKVNDTYGHLIGDKVLIQVVKSAAKAIRKGDIFARYGGEEFLVILPGASMDDACKIGEKMRRFIEDTSVVDGNQTIRVTISIGVTAYPGIEVSNEIDLIKQADEMLYQAKDTGRNNVCAG